jgi:hypothetical protein
MLNFNHQMKRKILLVTGLITAWVLYLVLLEKLF